MIGRRRFLKSAGCAVGFTGALVAAPALALANSARSAAAPAEPDAPTSSVTSTQDAPDTAVPQLFQNLEVTGWKVVEARPVLGVRRRAVVGVGGGFVGEVLRGGGGSGGGAQTASLNLFLLNNGDGSTDTHGDHGLAVMELARVLAAREARGVPVPELLTFEERAAHHPDGIFSIDFVPCHPPIAG